ncbi:MAG: TMEM165/GDT1 family protein [Clostridiales Family XIII bacterium]|jgi:putative Ca2+/H+ antiporter (TMEM165/GDT1 family)|nr:TMEM165/GDT1 family protein [Clostridiales Family XIII bacterium]
MDSSIVVAFFVSAGAVTLAEMGDKTQLLAMAFAAKYRSAQVLAGVFLATAINHALAVAAGHLVTRFASAQFWIQAAASLSFILFGLWTIRGDRLEGEDKRSSKFGPVLTVATAFFIAEMGDKTQLTTIALAAKLPAAPLAVLAGTTAGMLIADSIGIVAGVVLRRKIPERKIKFVSASAFMLFGLAGGYRVFREDLGLPPAATAGILLALAAAALLAAFLLLRAEKKRNRPSPDGPAQR